jgi:putative mRNA 3-end processing factor
VYAYALGKAQRVLAGVLGADVGPAYTHGAVERLTRDYRAGGVALHETAPVSAQPKGTRYAGSLIVAPPSAAGSTWIRRFGDVSTAFASGWMQVRGARRRRGIDRGFVLSDHVDWPALLGAIEATSAENVWVTHGYRDQVVRYLAERGLNARSIASHWEGENDEQPVVADDADEATIA